MRCWVTGARTTNACLSHELREQPAHSVFPVGHVIYREDTAFSQQPGGGAQAGASVVLAGQRQAELRRQVIRLNSFAAGKIQIERE